MNVIPLSDAAADTDLAEPPAEVIEANAISSEVSSDDCRVSVADAPVHAYMPHEYTCHARSPKPCGSISTGQPEAAEHRATPTLYEPSAGTGDTFPPAEVYRESPADTEAARFWNCPVVIIDEKKAYIGAEPDYKLQKLMDFIPLLQTMLY